MNEQPGIPDVDAVAPSKHSIAILGAGGDLTERLLLPGLADVVERADGIELQVIGAARTPQSRADWQQLIRSSLAGGEVSQKTIESLASRADFLPTDASSAEELRALLDACTGAPILYIALPPAMGLKVAKALAQLDLPDDLRIAIEKPFGESLGAAEELNAELAAVIPERRLWRVDHFLGKSTALGLLGLRFGNALLEAGWSGDHIESVEIVYDEQLGVEGRGSFYDGTGALRDMLQSHLLLVLALTAMERPDSLTPVAVHDRMAELLGATRLWGDDPGYARRARYTEGRIDGTLLPSYADEPDVDADRGTETLAQVVLRVDTERWRDVPFVLRSGKAIGAPRAEVAITYRDADAPEGYAGDQAPNELRVSLRTGEVTLGLTLGDEGDASRLERAVVTGREAGDAADPYAQVLAGILENDTLLSVRGDIAEQCWRIVTPVLNAWQDGASPLEEYEAGSSGPADW